jgi:NADH:ubiquinone oxidoreductase subunit 5 (subunit L)/multisubunit Na+/H+ antiporter MnhA subunit
MSGLIEIDLKKIVAFSTLSQLGFILVIVSLGARIAGFFHLILHAFFKSLIFLCAGVLLHSFNTQRLKSFGCISNLFLIRAIFISSVLSIRGVIFFSGFFSKDLILDLVFNSKLNTGFYFLVILSIRLTVLYRSRIIMALISPAQKPFIEFSTSFILPPILFLSIISIFIGNYFI